MLLLVGCFRFCRKRKKITSRRYENILMIVPSKRSDLFGAFTFVRITGDGNPGKMRRITHPLFSSAGIVRLVPTATRRTAA